MPLNTKKIYGERKEIFVASVIKLFLADSVLDLPNPSLQREKLEFKYIRWF